MPKDQSNSSMIFIVGCPRSGTYLLSNILNHSKQIAIPTESHFIPLFKRYIPLFGNLDDLNNRARLLRTIYSFLEIWAIRAEEERDYQKMIQYSLLATREFSEAIIGSTHTFSDLLHALFRNYAILKGVPFYGDKSAFFQHIPLDKIDHAVAGRAKFIHIVRDGRDVCLSWMKLRVGPETISVAGRAWRGHVAGKRAWGKVHPNRYCEVRYEDLIVNLEREIRRICEFIGIEFRSEMLAFYQGEMAQTIAMSTTHLLLGSPIDSKNCGKWRTQMSREDIELFEWIAGDMLAELGYPVTNTKLSQIKKYRLRGYNMLSLLKAAFSYRTLRLLLKGTLPLALLLAEYKGIRINKIVNSKKWLFIEQGFRKASKTN
ncbi:MAG: sulfotransferase [Desulfobacula sp.]|jgi:hypothetical protein